MLRNYLVEVISNKLCVQITYINYNIPKIVICGNKYFLEIESLGREHPVRNRSPAGLLALARELAYPVRSSVMQCMKDKYDRSKVT